MLQELGRPGEDGTRAIHHDTVAVEDQVVLPPDDVDIGHGGVGLDRAPGHQRQAHLVLVTLERRGVDHHQQPRVGLEHASERSSITPEVLADDDRDIHRLDTNHEQLIARNEDAIFVEDGIVGQMVLRIASDDAAVLEYARAVLRDRGRGVACAEEAWLERAVRVPDDHREFTQAGVLQLRREVHHGLVAVGEKARSRGEIFDGIAADGHLADGEQVGSPGGGAPGGIDDLPRIARKVSDNRVELAERQAETGHSH